MKSRKLLNKTYLEKPFAPVASLAVSQVDDIFLRKLNDYLKSTSAMKHSPLRCLPIRWE
ncbi:MAG: hypothetical protein ACLR6J_16590 [Parabacteroides merdae]